MERIDIGCVPAEEPCASVGLTEDYKHWARLECKAYIAAMTRTFGEPPEGARFRVARNPHDYGSYYSVELVVDYAQDSHASYAERAQNGLGTWHEGGFTQPVIYEGHHVAHALEDLALLPIDAFAAAREAGTLPVFVPLADRHGSAA